MAGREIPQRCAHWQQLQPLYQGTVKPRYYVTISSSVANLKWHKLTNLSQTDRARTPCATSLYSFEYWHMAQGSTTAVYK